MSSSALGVRWLSLVFIAALLGAVALASPAGATPVNATVDAVGWWTSRPAAPMGDGGFEVALTPDGSAQSVAAIRVTVEKLRMSKLVLSLSESTSLGNEFNHIRVCRAAPGWSPANPGALADAPKMDCSAPFVDLVHRSGGWDGDLRNMLPNGGAASLGLVGVRDTPSPVSFFVDLTGAAIAGEGSPDDDAPAASGGGTGEKTATTEAPFSTGGSGFADPASSAFTPGVSSLGGSDLPVQAPASVAPVTGATDTASPGGPTQLASNTPHRAGPSRPWLRLVFLTPLSVLIGVGLVYARRFLTARGANFS